MSIQFHPLANIFPLLDGDEFGALVNDIRTNGLHEPIVLFEGMILDGRNRYRACAIGGIDARFETYDGVDPIAYVVSLNLRRRHLDESQRAMVAAKLANIRFGENQFTRGSANLPTLLEDRTAASPLSQSQAASLLNVSERSVRSAVEAAKFFPFMAEMPDGLLTLVFLHVESSFFLVA